MEGWYNMRKFLAAAVSLVTLFALCACSNSSNTETTPTPTAQNPVITLKSWTKVYLTDDTSDLDQYLYALTFESTVPIPANKEISLDIELFKDEESKLVADAYYDEVTFNGLTEFTVVVSFNSYSLDADQMKSIKDIDDVKAEAWIALSSTPPTEESPLAYKVVDKDKISVEKSYFGVRNDLVYLTNDNYPEIGNLILTIKGQTTPIIIPMSEDLNDTELYSGYAIESIDLSKVEKAEICADANAYP